MGKMVIYFLNFCFQTGNQFVCFILIEFQDTCHFDFHQAKNIFLSHFTHKLRIERSQAFVNVFAGNVHVFSLLKLFVLIDTLFDEYLFQRSEMQGFQCFVLLDFQFFPEQVTCIIDGFPQYVTDCQEE